MKNGIRTGTASTAAAAKSATRARWMQVGSILTGPDGAADLRARYAPQTMAAPEAAEALAEDEAWNSAARQAAPRLLGSLHDPSGTPLIPPVADPADPTPFAPAAEASLLPLFPDWHYRLSPARDASAASGWLPGDLLSGALSAPALRLAFGGVLFGLLLLSLVAAGAVLLRVILPDSIP